MGEIKVRGRRPRPNTSNHVDVGVAHLGDARMGRRKLRGRAGVLYYYCQLQYTRVWRAVSRNRSAGTRQMVPSSARNVSGSFLVMTALVYKPVRALRTTAPFGVASIMGGRALQPLNKSATPAFTTPKPTKRLTKTSGPKFGACSRSPATAMAQICSSRSAMHFAAREAVSYSVPSAARHT